MDFYSLVSVCLVLHPQILFALDKQDGSRSSCSNKSEVCRPPVNLEKRDISPLKYNNISITAKRKQHDDPHMESNYLNPSSHPINELVLRKSKKQRRFRHKRKFRQLKKYKLNKIHRKKNKKLNKYKKSAYNRQISRIKKDFRQNEKKNNVNFHNNKISDFSKWRKHQNHPGQVKRRHHFKVPRGAQKVVVRTHNFLRSRVWPPASNMLAMSWNSEAARQAQLWAEECRLDDERDHPSVRWTSNYGTCGQNVYVTQKKQRWSKVLRIWWNTKSSFFYSSPFNNKSAIESYAQMAWYSSHMVGCGFSSCQRRSGKKYYRYVCNYCPSGNYSERVSKPYKKGRSCASCPSSCKPFCKDGGCKLCTNYCPYANLWENCDILSQKWNQWLCNTKTRDGVQRFKNCRASCSCQGKIT